MCCERWLLSARSARAALCVSLTPPRRPSFSVLFTVYLACARCLCLYPCCALTLSLPLHFSLLLYNISLTPSFPTTFNFCAQPSGICLSLIFWLLYGRRRTKCAHITSQKPALYELLRSKYFLRSVCIYQWLQQHLISLKLQAHRCVLHTWLAVRHSCITCLSKPASKNRFKLKKEPYLEHAHHDFDIACKRAHRDSWSCHLITCVCLSQR